MKEENLTVYASLENIWDWNISDFWKGEWWLGDRSGRENLHRISFCFFGSWNYETVLSIKKKISARDGFLFFFFKEKELKGGDFRWSGSSFIIRGRCLGNWGQAGVTLCCLHGCTDTAHPCAKQDHQEDTLLEQKASPWEKSPQGLHLLWLRCCLVPSSIFKIHTTWLWDPGASPHTVLRVIC